MFENSFVNNSNGLDRRQWLSGVAAGKWTTVGVSLKCFAKAGADVSKVNHPLAITSSGKLDLSLSQVKLGTVADKVHACK